MSKLQPAPGTFKGFKGTRPAVKPKVKAVFIGGKLRKPKDALDRIIFGTPHNL